MWTSSRSIEPPKTKALGLMLLSRGAGIGGQSCAGLRSRDALGRDGSDLNTRITDSARPSSHRLAMRMPGDMCGAAMNTDVWRRE